MVNLSKVVKFEKGPYPYKYTAILKDGKRVNFGNINYEHYKDQVPIKYRLYSHLNHLDKERRANYRKRHRAIKTNGQRAINKKYSPAWFSYNLLW